MSEYVRIASSLLEKISVDVMKMLSEGPTNEKIEMFLSEIISELNFTTQVSALNEGLCQQICDLDKIVQAQKIEYESVSNEKMILHSKFLSYSSDLTQLRDENFELTRKLKFLESINEASMTKCSKYLDKINVYEKSNNDLKSAIESSKSVISNLKTQESVLRQSLANCEARIKAYESSDSEHGDILKKQKILEQNFIHQLSVLEQDRDLAKQEMSKLKIENDKVLRSVFAFVYYR